MKTITLHAHAGPNPWKVALILEELSLPYETKVWATADQKKPPFTTTLNPNGFTPVLQDPNTNVILWESGAIIEFLLETYDVPNRLISFPSSSAQDRAHLLQYCFFQCTFQGPNLSIAFYFTRARPYPEARRRFIDESIRVLEVLNGALKEKEWLVGGKCTAADLVFIPYFWSMPLIMGDEKPDMAKEFPNVDAWVQRVSSRATVKKVMSDRTAAATAAGIPTSPPKTSN